MIEGARYAHTNLIASGWRKIAALDIEQFGCSLVLPERNFSGPDLEAGTPIPGAALSGVHLRLPGHGDEDPTLEIFTYSELADSLTPRVNRPGYGHLAFQVNSVADTRQQVLPACGDSVGDIVTQTTAARKPRHRVLCLRP